MKKELGIGLLLLMVCGVMTFLEPASFLSKENLQNLATLIGMFGVFSIGAGVVIITSGIDLSIGSVFALQGVVFCMMLQGGYGWPTALALTTLGMVFVGLIHGFLIAQLNLQPFIVTLCGLLFYRGLARFITDEQTKGLGATNYGVLEYCATGKLGPVPMPFVLLIIVAVIMGVVLHGSVYGRYLYAIGRNEEAARYSGINTKVIIGVAYVISMITASISGILFVFYSDSVLPSSHGNFYELYGIAAAVLGGCSLRGGEGSILGILLGTALLQVLQNAVNLLPHAKSSLQLCVMGAVILLGALLDQWLKTRQRKGKGA